MLNCTRTGSLNFTTHTLKSQTPKTSIVRCTAKLRHLIETQTPHTPQLPWYQPSPEQQSMALFALHDCDKSTDSTQPNMSVNVTSSQGTLLSGMLAVMA